MNCDVCGSAHTDTYRGRYGLKVRCRECGEVSYHEPVDSDAVHERRCGL